MSANGLHRIRWKRVAVSRVHGTAASQFARDLVNIQQSIVCLLYTSPSPRDLSTSRMPSSA